MDPEVNLDPIFFLDRIWLCLHIKFWIPVDPDHDLVESRGMQKTNFSGPQLQFCIFWLVCTFTIILYVRYIKEVRTKIVMYACGD
jgi:hypothetical protein